MRALLDTQCFLWYVLDDQHLSGKALSFISDEQNEILISPASYWEISIKISLGKYTLKAPFEAFWRSGMENNGFAILPIELRHTAELINLPFHHRDPFDRLLVAQAMAENIDILSADSQLDSYSIRRIW